MKSLRIAALAAVLFAHVLPRAEAGTVYVDIFAGFDLTAPPTGIPFTDHVGQLVLSSDDFGLYDFGQPFGLSSFAARITFTMYMNATGYYIGGLDSGTAPVLWTKGYSFNPQYGAQDWASGSYFGEDFYWKGFHDFEILYLGIPDAIPNGTGTVGGGPHTLGIGFFEPWGGDPRVNGGRAHAYVLPDPIEIHDAPDSIETFGAIVGTMLALLAIRRKYFRVAAA